MRIRGYFSNPEVFHEQKRLRNINISFEEVHEMRFDCLHVMRAGVWNFLGEYTYVLWRNICFRGNIQTANFGSAMLITYLLSRNVRVL
jgi:hypothetical protein